MDTIVVFQDRQIAHMQLLHLSTDFQRFKGIKQKIDAIADIGDFGLRHVVCGASDFAISCTFKQLTQTTQTASALSNCAQNIKSISRNFCCGIYTGQNKIFLLGDRLFIAEKDFTSSTLLPKYGEITFYAEHNLSVEYIPR